MASFGYEGTEQPHSGASDFNAVSFVIAQALARLNISAVVKVVAVTDPGGVNPSGTVDVTPLVNQLDAARNAIPHGVIYSMPYFRLQGGANAIIITPEVGDIGIAVFSDRDISSVKATKKRANPGSLRRFDMADGMYLGGLLNGTPTQYVQFSPAGIRVHSPTAVILEAPDVQILAATVEINATASVTMTTPVFQLNGRMAATGDIVAVGTSLHTHTHGGVAAGGASTGAPN